MILQTQNTEDQPDFQMTLVTQHLHWKHKERGTDIGTEIFGFFSFQENTVSISTT